MKRLALNAIATCLCLFVFTTGTLAEKCDRLISYDFGIVKESIEEDLANATWTTDFMGNPSSMFFYADGSVEIIVSDKKKNIVEFATWGVRMIDSQAILDLIAADGTIRSLRINPTCEGFATLDMNGYSEDLFKESDYNVLLINQMKRQIVGEWTTVAQSDLNADRAIAWNFKADGTFELAVAPGMYHTAHQGVWDLSPKGNFIVLYFTNDTNPESVYAIELMKIKSVDFEDLVVDGKIMPRVLREFATSKALNFEKTFGL